MEKSADDILGDVSRGEKTPYVYDAGCKIQALDPVTGVWYEGTVQGQSENGNGTEVRFAGFSKKTAGATVFNDDHMRFPIDERLLDRKAMKVTRLFASRLLKDDTCFHGDSHMSSTVLENDPYRAEIKTTLGTVLYEEVLAPPNAKGKLKEKRKLPLKKTSAKKEAKMIASSSASSTETTSTADDIKEVVGPLKVDLSEQELASVKKKVDSWRTKTNESNTVVELRKIFDVLKSVNGELVKLNKNLQAKPDLVCASVSTEDLKVVPISASNSSNESTDICSSDEDISSEQQDTWCWMSNGTTAKQSPQTSTSPSNTIQPIQSSFSNFPTEPPCTVSTLPTPPCVFPPKSLSTQKALSSAPANFSALISNSVQPTLPSVSPQLLLGSSLSRVSAEQITSVSAQQSPATFSDSSPCGTLLDTFTTPSTTTMKFLPYNPATVFTSPGRPPDTFSTMYTPAAANPAPAGESTLLKLSPGINPLNTCMSTTQSLTTVEVPPVAVGSIPLLGYVEETEETENPDNTNYLDPCIVHEIMIKSRSSRTAFVARLTSAVFSLAEIEGRNVNGLQNKGKLNHSKVNFIKRNVFAFFPTIAASKEKVWRTECVKAIDRTNRQRLRLSKLSYQ